MRHRARSARSNPFAKGTYGRGLIYGFVAFLLVTLISQGAQADTPAPSDDSAQNFVTTASTRTIRVADYDPNPTTAPLPDLAITVSQTQDLISQGIVVSWSGGKKSTYPAGPNLGRNFLQIMQCWGDDPNNPGHPDRTTCQYGGTSVPGATRDNTMAQSQVQPGDAQYSVPGTGFLNPAYVSIPFRAPTGETVKSIVRDSENKPQRDLSVSMGVNQFFTQYTTNEITWAGSGDNGNGAAKFEVQTAQQAPGLGCGEALVKDGVTTGRPCWLVVIPRGTADNNRTDISTSGLLSDSWSHNIAFRLGFRPLGVRCQLGTAERQVSGTELSNLAFYSWQPELCKGASGSAFVVNNINEKDALSSAASPDGSPLALASSPLDNDSSLSYAPLAVAGVAVTFAIDRQTVTNGVIPNSVKARDKTPFTAMNLTPRLIAKLLTASYRQALPPVGLNELAYFSKQGFNNPQNLTQDPDFLSINDIDWQYQNLNAASLADVLMPSGRTDMISQLWKYVLSNQDAVDFLNGKPDPWGMVVNPWFSTNAKLNPAGVALALPSQDLPKSDPIEKPDTTTIDVVTGSGPINLVTWRPYISDFDTGAYQTLRGDGLLLGGWLPDSSPPKFAKTTRAALGTQRVIALSDTPSAARYQTVTASLLNPAGEFVAPSTASLYSAESVMTPTATNQKVCEFNFNDPNAKAAKGAYPLAMPIYAALNPKQSDFAARAAYANMVRFAVTSGQVVGTELGQLPLGYAPLRSDWVAQALAAANLIQAGITAVEASPAATAIPSVTPSPSPSQTYSSAEPTPQPSYSPSTDGQAAGALYGPTTVADPPIPVTAQAMPMGFDVGLLLSFLYPMFSRYRRAS